MNDFMDLVKERYSCRSFLKAPVEREKIELCLEAARFSPSARNTQPWFYTIVEEPETVRRVAACLQREGANGFTDDAPVFAVVSERKLTGSSIGGAGELQKFAQFDLGLSVAHFCLEAYNVGLSCCIIGWIDADGLHSACALPEDDCVRVVIALGYNNGDSRRPKERFEQAEMSKFI